MVDGARPRFLCSEIRASTLSVAAKLHTMSNKYQNWSGLRILLITRIDQPMNSHSWDLDQKYHNLLEIRASTFSVAAKLYTLSNKYQNWSSKNYCKISWLTQL